MSDEKQREKVREVRLRRTAERQGYKLMKSPRRDPRALDYDKWQISVPTPRGNPARIKEMRKHLVTRLEAAFGPAGEGYERTIDEVEAFLTGEEN